MCSFKESAMKKIHAIRPHLPTRTFLAGLGLGLLLGTLTAPAATYNEEDVVGDFTLHARRAFTNDAGATVPAGAPVRLTDFKGKIVFLEFFYYW